VSHIGLSVLNSIGKSVKALRQTDGLTPWSQASRYLKDGWSVLNKLSQVALQLGVWARGLITLHRKETGKVRNVTQGIRVILWKSLNTLELFYTHDCYHGTLLRYLALEYPIITSGNDNY
jgi:hypothetical protein